MAKNNKLRKIVFINLYNRNYLPSQILDIYWDFKLSEMTTKINIENGNWVNYFILHGDIPEELVSIVIPNFVPMNIIKTVSISNVDGFQNPPTVALNTKSNGVRSISMYSARVYNFGLKYTLWTTTPLTAFAIK